MNTSIKKLHIFFIIASSVNLSQKMMKAGRTAT